MRDRLLFVPSVERSEWLHKILPGMSLAELPLAGRRFIDYALESAQKSEIKLAGILDWHVSQRLFADCGNLSSRGIPVFCQKGQGPVPRGLNELDQIIGPFTNPVQDGLVVVWGICLTSHKLEEITFEPISDEECADTPAGLYCREGGRWLRFRPQGVVVKDVKSWQRLNFAVLENSWLFTLPGYSSEKDVYLGRNVVLERGVEIKPPVILQDNTWCARNVRFDGDVVVGQGSFVGEGAHLQRTVIGENTYVGMGLDLVDKIVVGNRIIDAETGTWTDVSEPGLVHQIGVFGWDWFRKLWKFLLGTSHGRSG